MRPDDCHAPVAGLAHFALTNTEKILINLKKTALWLLLAALVVAYIALDVGHWLRLDMLQHSLSALQRLHTEQPWMLRAAYFGLYVLATALSFPGAVLLTLAGGALFGLGWGTLIISLASSIGATLAFWAARWLLRDAVQARFGARLAEFNQGIATEGAFYLFTLRLVPLVPFFVINLLMGLTRMKTWTFYAVSQIGMLPGTLAYVNAGTQLAQLDSVAGILSPALLGSLVLLGALPWLARQTLAWWGQRQRYARWRHLKPRRFEHNLIVIGAGAGGLVSAYIGAAVKAKVTLVEAHKMGGDCLNYGCVPSKALLKSAQLAHQMRHGAQYGLSNVAPVCNLPDVMRRVQAVVAAIAPHDSVARYTALGVQVLQGHAKITNPWTVQVTHANGHTQNLTSRAIVIATGAQPIVPALPGLTEVGYLTSETLWSTLAALPTLPQRWLVLGGGPMGCELAQSLQRLGAQVTQIERGPRLLAREDDTVSTLITQSLQADGVRVLYQHQALRCEPLQATPRGASIFGPGVLVLAHQGQETRLEFDVLLCAVGRRARLAGYGLEALGIDTQGATLPTNAYLQTCYPNILAVGDVVGPHQFTHAAAHQAWYASVNALFGHLKKFKLDDRLMPRVTFTDPEVACVGLNQRQAREQNVAFEVTHFPLDGLDRALMESQTPGFIQVLTPPGRDRILGVTIVGAHAGELLGEYLLAMKHGLGLNQMLGTLHPYPTWSEAAQHTAGTWKRGHLPQRLLGWAAQYHAWRRG